MSVIDQIKKLLPSKTPASEPDASMSLAMPDQGGDAESFETVQQTLATRPAPLNAESAAMATTTRLNPDMVDLPLLGARTVERHVRVLGIGLGLALLALTLLTVYALSRSNKVAQQLGATGQSLVQSQRLAKSVSPAMLGNAQALADVADSAGLLVKSANGLREGDSDINLSPLPASLGSELDKVSPLVEKAEKNAKAVLQQQKVLTEIGAALGQINRQSGELLELAQSISSAKVQQNAAAAEVAAVGNLMMLAQRVGKSANEFLSSQGDSAAAIATLGRNLASIKEISLGLLNGNVDLRLSPAKDATSREQLEALSKRLEATQALGNAILSNTPGLTAARQGQLGILADGEALRHSIEDLQAQLSAQAGVGVVVNGLMVLAAVIALLSAAGLFNVQLQESRRRQAAADHQRHEAERQEQDAKRVNDANQAAILRLMNELQTVAEGDLTQEATVTEDITGAIADSVNYTVEELRSLVSNVQNTVARVAQTTSDVDATSTELLAASKEQLHEIRATGQGVLEMAGRINDVSTQAQESARVARQSLMAAESGLTAVQNAIGGMNAIREQIQETSKRIKRLGESSQEIGEITELISDITEQTNVLALNAAIQAASAGDAGRGFSVVAEEVQRLAERSADATRQIAALVKAIQTDTQDAIGAMERSTQGVVEGAKLSDNAGTALTEIDRVSRRVADLIEQISNAASHEAGLANDMAENIQHIFAVTEQTGEGTRVTAGQVRELSRMADELRQSVSRFKIA